MEKDFIPYDRALRMKALGFDEPCFGRYGEIDNLEFRFFKEPKSFDYGVTSKTCLAPTFSQAFKWFREKYTLAGYSFPNALGSYGFTIVTLSENHHSISSKMFDTYEEAELACLDKLIEIVESKSE